jgi:hypothetical protein
LSASIGGTALALLMVGTLATACSNTDRPPPSHETAATSAHPSKVLVVIEENHSFAQMKADMPFLFGLATEYGYATNWTAIRHPSLPNYLAITGGSTFGVADDRSPAAHQVEVGDAKSVFDQALDAGKTARTYAESMPKPCFLHDYPAAAPAYTVRHNPWAYYSASRTRCRRHDVPMAGFATTARRNALPDLGFLIPNLCDDAHSCSPATADAFLKRTLPDVLASSDFTSGRLAVIVTGDEDDRSSGNKVLTTVMSTRLSHRVVTRQLDHYSLTRYLAQVLGVRPLQNGRTAPDMRAAFGL